MRLVGSTPSCDKQPVLDWVIDRKPTGIHFTRYQGKGVMRIVFEWVLLIFDDYLIQKAS
jgi:hypothetical protein